MNDDCRVVLLSGFGNTFSSGIDLAYLLESEQDRKTAAKNMAEALRYVFGIKSKRVPIEGASLFRRDRIKKLLIIL